MKKNGTGGALTKTGATHEDGMDRLVCTALDQVTVPGSQWEPCSKTTFKKWWNQHNPSIPLSSLWSKTLQPDFAIYHLDTRTLFVLEYKMQSTPGSTDEKLMAGPVLKDTYSLLEDPSQQGARPIDRVIMGYLLSEWFLQDRYRTMFLILRSYEPALQYMHVASHSEPIARLAQFFTQHKTPQPGSIL